MSRQIIRQPNGKFAVFSSIIDGFVLTDATREDVVALFLEDARENIERTVDRVLEKITAGKKPYYQFTLTWEEAKEEHERRHGALEELKQ